MKPLTLKDLLDAPVGTMLDVQHRDGEVYAAMKRDVPVSPFFVSGKMPGAAGDLTKWHDYASLIAPGNYVWPEGKAPGFRPMTYEQLLACKRGDRVRLHRDAVTVEYEHDGRTASPWVPQQPSVGFVPERITCLSSADLFMAGSVELVSKPQPEPEARPEPGTLEQQLAALEERVARLERWSGHDMPCGSEEDGDE